MPDTGSLMLFLLAAFVLLVTPGPAVLYIVARSLDQGRVAGLLSTLGVGFGSLVHVAAVALGLTAVLASSEATYNTVKFLGSAYLVYLGIERLRSGPPAPVRGRLSTRSRRRLFLDGAVINVFNPKTALFFVAFLPQFVDPEQVDAARQLAFLGTLFVLMGILSDGAYALLAGSLRHRLGANRRFQRLGGYLSGAVFIGLGVTTALT